MKDAEKRLDFLSKKMILMEDFMDNVEADSELVILLVENAIETAIEEYHFIKEQNSYGIIEMIEGIFKQYDEVANTLRKSDPERWKEFCKSRGFDVNHEGSDTLA